MPTVLITGGTGMIGRALTTLLMSRGYDIIVMGRQISAKQYPKIQGCRYAEWDISKQVIDAAAIAEADHIIHLAGAGVADKRWTKKRKRTIQQSRTKSAEFLVKSLSEIPNKVRTVVSASAIGWYKPALSAEGGFQRIETDPPDPGFLGRTCKLWEQSIEPVIPLGKRLVILRTGIVLSNAGGALPEFKKPVHWGFAAILGNGKQMLSWIHIEDLCRIYREAIENNQLQGVYNAVAPRPVNNKTMTIQLARQMKGSFYIPFYIPAFLLKLFLGEMSVEVLKSVLVSAEKIKKTGFQFLYPSIESALQTLVKESRSA